MRHDEALAPVLVTVKSFKLKLTASEEIEAMRPTGCIYGCIVLLPEEVTPSNTSRSEISRIQTIQANVSKSHVPKHHLSVLREQHATNFTASIFHHLTLLADAFGH